MNLRSKANVCLVEVEQAIVGDCDAVGVARKIREYLLRAGNVAFGVHNPLGYRRDARAALNAFGFLRAISPVWNWISPATNRASRPSRNSCLNTREIRRTGRNRRFAVIQCLPSDEMPPPGTTQCACG